MNSSGKRSASEYEADTSSDTSSLGCETRLGKRSSMQGQNASFPFAELMTTQQQQNAYQHQCQHGKSLAERRNGTGAVQWGRGPQRLGAPCGRAR
jgi:hypothetical protein